MSETEIPKNYFGIFRRMLTILGIQLYDGHGYIVTKFLNAISIGPFLLTAVSSYELYSNENNPAALLDLLPYFANYFIGSIVFSIVHYNRKGIIRLLDSLEDNQFRINFQRCGEYELKQINRAISFSLFQLKAYIISSVVVLVLAWLLTLTQRLQGKFHLPLMQMTIVNIQQSPHFELACLYQVFSVTQISATVATLDTLIASILIQINAQLLILNESIRLIPTRVNPTEIEDQIKNGPDNSLLDEFVRNVIEHHAQIIAVWKKYESIFNVVLFVKFLGCILILCFILFQMAQLPIMSSEFLKNVVYYMLMSGQVLMFCWWGNQCTDTALQTATMAAQARWPGEPPYMRRASVMIIRQAQKPIQFTAGKIMVVSMQTYLSIIKGGFSYFMVLSQANEEVAT